MGLAASQARFLGLTARKSNNEFQAQQINEQRLALANDQTDITKNYHEKLSNRMFYYNDGNEETLSPQLSYWDIVNPASDSEHPGQGCRIVDVNGNKVVPNYLGFPEDDPDIRTIVENYNITEEAKDNTILQKNIENGTWKMIGIRVTPDGERYEQEIPFEEALVENGGFIARMRAENPDDETDREYWRLFNTLAEKIDGKYQELSFENLTTMKDLPIFLQDSEGKTVAPELPEADRTIVYGQYCVDPNCVDSVYLEEKLRNGEWFIQTHDTTRESGWSVNKSWSSVNFIEDSYNVMDDAEAEAEYEYLMAKFQKQDKLLEMRLKQLETEHKALETELDSITKVIQTNIESSFKTFA